MAQSQNPTDPKAPSIQCRKAGGTQELVPAVHVASFSWGLNPGEAKGIIAI